MFVSAKRILLHPSRVATLRPGEVFEIPSGMGGTFTLSFTGFENHLAAFVIVHHSDPPDGWNGTRCTYPIATLHEHLCGIAPDSPYMDDAKHELITLGYLGYPPDSPEITALLKRFPKTAAAISQMDRYMQIQDQLTATTKRIRHRCAHRGARYSGTQAPLVAEQELIAAGFKARHVDYFPRFHHVWLAVRQPTGWHPIPYQP